MGVGWVCDVCVNPISLQWSLNVSQLIAPRLRMYCYSSINLSQLLATHGSNSWNACNQSHAAQRHLMKMTFLHHGDDSWDHSYIMEMTLLHYGMCEGDKMT